MRQYDVLPNPNRTQQRQRPFLLVLQHDRLSHVPTLAVAPLAPARSLQGEPRLMPTLSVLGAPMVLVTTELSAIGRHRLTGPVLDNLSDAAFEIQNALDVVFSAAG